MLVDGFFNFMIIDQQENVIYTFYKIKLAFKMSDKLETKYSRNNLKLINC